jgi:guanylate kinase
MSSLIIVVGPSGAGKSSFVERAVEEMPILVDVITCTTRKMREGERQGYPYHFLQLEDFQKKINAGYFVEYAKVHDNYYGTPKNQIEQTWAEGKAVIMDVDVQGAETFLKKYPQQAKAIFILPPSIDILRKRVILRDKCEPHDLDLRMENGKKEMSRANEFDYQLVNDDFEVAFSKFKKIIEKIVSPR